MKPQSVGNDLPAFGLIFLGVLSFLLRGISQHWPPMAELLLDPELARALGICLAACGLALLVPHHHQSPASKRKATTTARREAFSAGQPQAMEREAS